MCHLKLSNDFVGMSPSDIIESSTLVQGTNKTKSLAEKVLETGEAVYNIEGSVKLKGADKSLFVICSATPIKDDSGVIIGSLTVLTDMTEMKEKKTEIQNILNYTHNCLNDLGEGIRKLGEGDLDIHIEKIKDDEFGKTFDEFNDVVINLKSIVEEILEDMTKTLEEAQQSEEAVNQMNMGMQQISTASEQIATGSKISQDIQAQQRQR